MPERNGPIQLIPPGFLSLLQLKNQGHMPADLGEVVSPTMDMRDWYLQVSARTPSTTFGLVLTSEQQSFHRFSPNGIIVPQGKTWWVHHYMVQCGLTAVAGQSIFGLAPIIIWNANGTIKYNQLGPAPATGLISSTATNPTGTQVFASGFWAPPGAELGFTNGEIISAAGISFGGVVRYTELDL